MFTVNRRAGVSDYNLRFRHTIHLPSARKILYGPSRRLHIDPHSLRSFLANKDTAIYLFAEGVPGGNKMSN